MTPNQKIKLLIVTPSLQCGGSEKYVSTLCNNIDRNKFEVTLVVINNADQFYNIDDGIKVIDLKTKRSRFSILKIRSVVKKQKPDIIFSVANHVNILLAMFRWLFPSFVKIVARESSLVSHNSNYAKNPEQYKKLIRRFYHKLDGIVCQSKAMQQDLVANFGVVQDKTIVIHNAVETTSFVETTKQQTHKFITVARLSPEKGIERILNGLSKFDEPFEYYIIGDGNEKAKLQKLAKELQLENKVIFIGQKKEPFAGMENASLFLFGSYHEGFPNAVLEAGAFGIPVVAFPSHGGIEEIIMNGENGFLINNNNAEAFTATIHKALQHPFDRKKISETTAQRFSVDSVINETTNWLLHFIK